MEFMKRLIIVLSFLISSPGFGIGTDKVAHFGTSFMMQTVGYGLVKKLITEDRFEAVVLTAVIVLGIGAFKEMWDSPPDANDILANTIGVGTAIGATFVFEF